MHRQAALAVALFAGTAASPAAATPALLLDAPEAQADVVAVEPEVESRDDARRWHVDLLARTDFPVDAGAALDFETPSRIRFGIGVGTIPRGYITAINSVSENAGWYDGETSQLISSTLQSSIVVHPNVGVRPFRRSGFILDGGLKLAFLGGDSAGAELISAATGVTAPAVTSAAGSYTLAAESFSGMATARIGWLFEAGDSMVVRLDIGGAFTVFANNTIEAPADSAQPAVWEKLTTAGEVYLDDMMNTYVRTATIGLGVGWRVR